MAARRHRGRRHRSLGDAAACSKTSRLVRGGIGLVAGYIGGYIANAVIAPAPTTTAMTTTSVLPTSLTSMLPYIGAIGGAWYAARAPEC